eukprot:7520629-Pyramimonas_sp.AAC.1
MLGARIDLGTNQIELERLGVKADMRRLPTGHRTMRLDDFGVPISGAVFKCPRSVLSQHPEVKVHAFRSETASSFTIVSPSSSPRA